MGMKIVVGADSAGVEYKDAIKAALAAMDGVSDVLDVGVPSNDDPRPYPDVAIAAAEMVARGEGDRAILVCGTGIGMAISANKVAGVRASTAHDSFSVERLVLSNDAQILCLGQRVIGRELALRLAREFVGYAFNPESASATKVAGITAYEETRDAASATDPAHTAP